MYDILEDCYDIDSRITKLEDELSMLNDQKKNLMKQIMDEKTEESDNFFVHKSVKLANKTVSVDILKENYPSAYEQMKTNMAQKINSEHEEDLKHVGEKFSQADAKAVLSKPEFESVLERNGESTITYTIRPKKMVAGEMVKYPMDVMM